MSKIKKIKVNNVEYDVGADYSNIENAPTFKTINGQTITGTGNITIEGGSGELSTEVKNAILDCFENVAWVNENGQNYYDALSNLFFPPKTLVSISAVFNQGQAVIYDNASLDDLKQYLTVTASYSDSSTETITNYTLSGTLTEGTSTITVTYESKTTTFDVTVTAVPTLSSIEATFTQGQAVISPSTPLNNLKQYLVVVATYSNSSTVTLQDSDYTLSGTLATGTSTITVAYEGKTDTFTVTVTEGTSDMNGWTDGIGYTNLTIIENQYCKKDNGSFINYNGWDRTGYVPCDGAANIIFSPAPQTESSSAQSNWFYDSNKNPVSQFSISKTLSTTISVPSNAYYFVISSERAALQTCISNGIVPHAPSNE